MNQNSSDYQYIYILTFSGAEPHVNTCYKHFYYFVREFHLMNDKEFEPLKEMTVRICTDLLQQPQNSMASAASTKTTSNTPNKSTNLPATVEER